MSAMASVRFWAVTTRSSRKAGGFDVSSAAVACPASWVRGAGGVFFASSDGGAS